MWQDKSGMTLPVVSAFQNPVLDLEIRGLAFRNEKGRGRGALCFYPCGPLFMTLQSAHGQLFRAFHAARPVHDLPSLALPTASE